MIRLAWMLVVFSSFLGAQQSGAGSAPEQSGRQQPPIAKPDEGDAAQLRNDLDRLDSLLSNMNSEIEFLRDQNLQILLRTNSQMWALVIRDMRKHLAAEQNRKAAPEATPGPSNEVRR